MKNFIVLLIVILCHSSFGQPTTDNLKKTPAKPATKAISPIDSTLKANKPKATPPEWPKTILFTNIEKPGNPEINHRIEKAIDLKLDVSSRLEHISRQEMKNRLRDNKPQNISVIDNRDQLIQIYQPDLELKVNLSTIKTLSTRTSWYLFFIGKQVSSMKSIIELRKQNKIIARDTILIQDTLSTGFCGLINCRQTSPIASQRIYTQNTLSDKYLSAFSTFMLKNIYPEEQQDTTKTTEK